MILCVSSGMWYKKLSRVMSIVILHNTTLTQARVLSRIFGLGGGSDSGWGLQP